MHASLPASPPPIQMSKPHAQGDGIRRRDCGEVIRSWGWSLMKMSNAVMKETTERPLIFSTKGCCSVTESCQRPHGLQHIRLPCPSLSPGVCSNSCPLSRWCHPTILSSVTPFSFCIQSFPAPGSFPVNRLLASGGQSRGASASASVLPMNIQDWFPLGWTGLWGHSKKMELDP